jgi:hypothetical protein
VVFRTPEEISAALQSLLHKIATMPFPPPEFTIIDLAIARVISRAAFAPDRDPEPSDGR